MNKVSIFVLLVLFSVGVKAQETSKEFLITAGTVGNYRLSESIYDVLERVKDEKKYSFGYFNDNGEEVPCVFLYLGKPKEITIILELKKVFNQLGATDDVVSRIIVFDKSFETDQGIKVGSTYAQLALKYEILTKDCGNIGNKSCTVKVNNFPADFIFNMNSKMVAKSLSREGEEVVIPDDTKIGSIAIGYIAK